MAELWYYAGPNNQPQGPVPREQLLGLVTSGAVGPATLVWRNGMAAWAAASSLPELSAAFAGPPAMPPPMAAQTSYQQPVYQPQAAPRAAYSAASAAAASAAPPAGAAPAAAASSGADALTTVHPWRRFFARMLDGVLFGVVATLALGQFGYGFEYQMSNQDLGRQTVIAIINTLLFTIYDASLIAATGTSPFRWLYGIHVLKQDGSRPDFMTALMRSLKRLVFGFGLGIPVVGLITTIIQYFMLKSNGISSWDRTSGTISQHYRISGGKMIALVLVWLLLLGGLVLLTFLFIGLALQMAQQQGIGIGK
jgi:hypothetical protein